jgi:hypothetical protein
LEWPAGKVRQVSVATAEAAAKLAA